MLVESVLLRDIQLPATLKASIEAKQQAEQEALAMNFRLQKETQEAQRKRIEAAGIRDFQQIVAQGISPQLLEWKGIEATETLAKSANAKIVVIGNSKNGLPLILGHNLQKAEGGTPSGQPAGRRRYLAWLIFSRCGIWSLNFPVQPRAEAAGWWRSAISVFRLPRAKCWGWWANLDPGNRSPRWP